MRAKTGWAMAWAVTLVAVFGGCDGTGGDTVTSDDLRAVFIRRSACRDTLLTPTLATILANADGLSAAASSELACGRSTGSCEEFLACSGIDPAAPCDVATTPSCDADALVSCDSTGLVRRQDCASDDDGNVTCLVDEGGRAQCATGTCAGPMGLRCEADAIVFCGNGVERRSDDCALAGQRCAVTPEGDRAACVDRVEVCTSDACEGDVWLSCTDELGYDAISCADRLLGGRCAMVDGVARCVSDAMDCADGAAECAGDVARFCVDGAWVELDCASFLGGTCVDASQPDRPALRCAIP